MTLNTAVALSLVALASGPATVNGIVVSVPFTAANSRCTPPFTILGMQYRVKDASGKTLMGVPTIHNNFRVEP